MTQTKPAIQLENILIKPKEHYITKIKERFGEFDVDQFSHTVLFGAAEMGKIYIDLCQKNKIEVLAVCDNDVSKSGSFIDGVRIISVEKLLEFPKDTPIIITTIYDDEVYQQLVSLGFARVLTGAYLSVMHADKFYNPHWLNSINDILNQKNEVSRCFNILDDDDSRNNFLNIIQYRLSLDRSYIKKIMRPVEEEYFDKDIISLSSKEIFVDGGAYTGDTIANFLQITGGRFETIHSYEPDAASFAKLKEYIDSLADSRIFIYPLALGESSGSVKFSNCGALGSRISETGGIAVRIVDLDSNLNHTGPTFIKLDVEGWELEALKGAQKIIISHLPKLAVCVYHKPDDLWKVPLFLNDTFPKYRFFIRHYSPFLYDTICYAIH